jgi:hypothetical protein
VKVGADAVKILSFRPLFAIADLCGILAAQRCPQATRLCFSPWSFQIMGAFAGRMFRAVLYDGLLAACEFENAPGQTYRRHEPDCALPSHGWHKNEPYAIADVGNRTDRMRFAKP